MNNTQTAITKDRLKNRRSHRVELTVPVVDQWAA
jgi:hypothetical protein